MPGIPPAAAEARAAQFFDGLGARFADPVINPRYDAARVRLAQGALIPSRVFDDTVVWDGEARPSAYGRALYVSGELVNGRYHLETRPLLTPASHLGDTRHSISLEQVAPSVYRWDTNVDVAIGSITADEVATALEALFRSAGGQSEFALRENYRAAFPRAAAAFGRGFSVDTLRIAPGVAPAERGTTSVDLTIGFHPDDMRASFPAMAGYVDKYVGSARYHFSLADRTGAQLFDVVGRARTLTVHYRVHNGVLVTLAGDPRPWPDSLELTLDVLLKIKHLNVGFHDLHTSFVIENSGHERAWAIVARTEPQWDLPLAAEHLIRTPLRRPFSGDGAMFRLSIRDSAGAQTIFSRRTRLEVQESAIVRFLGALTSHAIGDLDSRVEIEEDRFIHEGLAALRADLGPLASRWSDGGAGAGSSSESAGSR